MAEVVWLAQDTYDRIIKMLDDYEEGNLKVIPGVGLKIEEVGKDGTKIGVDGTKCPT